MALPGPIPESRHDWETIRTLLPYLWAWKGRVVFALSCLLLAKLTNVAVPLVFKDIIDTFAPPAANRMQQAMLLVPLGLLATYGALRFSTASQGSCHNRALSTRPHILTPHKFPTDLAV